MSICSYSNYEAIFPKDTPISGKSLVYESVKEVDGEYRLFDEQEGEYSDSFLDELITLFGKPLDKVPGLHLDAYYSCYEDDGWECQINIDDGKVSCEQTEKVWKACDVEDVDVDLGGPRIGSAKAVWGQLGDVCVDDDDRIDDDVFLHATHFYRHYPKGTFREEIWHDIEDKLRVSVAYLMGEAKNPDGTN